LELEHRYGLMDPETTIDPRTATIMGAVPSHNGKARTEALLTPELGEASD
jgi:hypothetical protein